MTDEYEYPSDEDEPDYFYNYDDDSVRFVGLYGRWVYKNRNKLMREFPYVFKIERTDDKVVKAYLKLPEYEMMYFFADDLIDTVLKSVKRYFRTFSCRSNNS